MYILNFTHVDPDYSQDSPGNFLVQKSPFRLTVNDDASQITFLSIEDEKKDTQKGIASQITGDEKDLTIEEKIAQSLQIPLDALQMTIEEDPDYTPFCKDCP